jgi:hypothetical protein
LLFIQSFSSAINDKSDSGNDQALPPTKQGEEQEMRTFAKIACQSFVNVPGKIQSEHERTKRKYSGRDPAQNDTFPKPARTKHIPERENVTKCDVWHALNSEEPPSCGFHAHAA